MKIENTRRTINSLPEKDISQFAEAVLASKIIAPVLEEISKQTDNEYWIGAGAVAQTVWNFFTKRPCDYGIKDIDIAYYDSDDLSENEEIKKEKEFTNILRHISLPLDVKNQARVHTWYTQKFGYEISPYKNIEEAIKTWPTTATTIAIRSSRSNRKIEIIAPFGLKDLLSLTVRPNQKQITKEIYKKYCRRWKSKWPELKIKEWKP